MAEATSTSSSSPSKPSQPDNPPDPTPPPTNPTQPPPLQPPSQPTASVQPFTLPPPPPQPPVAPSFRPISAPQFSPAPSVNYHNHSVPPPGVSVPPGSAPQQPMMQYQMPLQMRGYAPPMVNGYPGVSPSPPQGTMPHPGLIRYPTPYPAMVRPGFPPRPPGTIGMMPAMSRPPVPMIPGVRPVTPPVVRPVVLPIVTPAEKPQTTVYVGKIAQTVDNDFMLSLLQICGPVKNWKRAQDPKDGKPKGFGFCEFESAEGVLRALRLLSKYNIDGQELVLNVNQATRDYLERYVEKKTENLKKAKESEAADSEKEVESAEGLQEDKPLEEESKKEENGSGNKGNHDIATLGIVTEEDKEADREALEKITGMIEKRLKTNPLPPPPPIDSAGKINSDTPTKLKDGESDLDTTRNAEDKVDKERTSDGKAASEHDKPETGSPDRDKKYDRRSRDREQELKREKERELERYEREAEREKIRKEREQRRRIEMAEREYEECLKEWEYREREKERQRQYVKEKEKEKRKRRREIIYDEEEDDDDTRRRWRRSELEEKRKRRQLEKEEDDVDRRREEEEIAEAKKRAEEEQLQQQQEREAAKLSSGQETNDKEESPLGEQPGVDSKSIATEPDNDVAVAHDNNKVDGDLLNGASNEETLASIPASETRQGNNAPAKKLGFGLVGSGKRASVPSVFTEEDEEDGRKEKKMRPLVPIDYSTEELHAVQPDCGAPNPNLAAAAEFAKQISTANAKEEKPDVEKDRSRRHHDRSSHKNRDRNEDSHHSRDERKEKTADRDKDRDRGSDRLKTPDNKKLLDAKQLIDTIPKTKEELFSYEINWTVYDQHSLHKRMRPWISKKITEFLGEEETTLVDYIVSSTQEHVKAPQMLELLQSILDEEAEMFVLKMWRMLIFEIKKVETGHVLKSK